MFGHSRPDRDAMEWQRQYGDASKPAPPPEKSDEASRENVARGFRREMAREIFRRLDTPAALANLPAMSTWVESGVWPSPGPVLPKTSAAPDRREAEAQKAPPTRPELKRKR